MDTIMNSAVGWIYDFKRDFGHFPSSLQDLIDNKAVKHNYNPERAIKSNREQGYDITYTLVNENNVKIKIERGDESSERSLED
jgi:hypothetical protein